jgi:hypothetical protein
MYADAEEQLSERLSLTPEGFLRVRDAVLARSGPQEYFTHELPTLDADESGWLIVNRPEAEVFDPRSLASYIGKPIVLLHPDDLVTPENVREHQIGTVLAARRGEGNNADIVVGDLMITDAEAIELIRRGTHRALSAGYDANYVQRGRGFADQRDIRINHVALLRNGDARCGPRCAIGDSRGNGKMRRRTRDQETTQSAIGEYKEALRLPNQSEMGSKPFGSVGDRGRLIARLPGRDGYTLRAGSSGDTLLYGPEPGYSVTGTSTPLSGPSQWRDAASFRQVARTRAASEQRAARKMAAQITDFWKQR